MPAPIQIRIALNSVWLVGSLLFLCTLPAQKSFCPEGKQHQGSYKVFDMLSCAGLDYEVCLTQTSV